MVSTHEKPIAGDSQPTQNIQINKVTGENEKCVLFYGKKLNQFFCQPISMASHGLTNITCLPFVNQQATDFTSNSCLKVSYNMRKKNAYPTYESHPFYIFR